MPRLRRGGRCITPRCSQEEQRRALHRQQIRVRRQRDNEFLPPRRKNGPTLGLAAEIDTALFLEQTVDERLQVHSCGTLTTQCPFCRALRWPGEKPSFCCQNGQVSVPLPPPPPPILSKYYDVSRDGGLFLPNSRAYNNALALASFGCDEKFLSGFNPTFTVQGQLCHRIGNLLPAPGDSPKFAQIFFHDSDMEVTNRLHHLNDLQDTVLIDFQNQLHTINNYVQSFQSAIEICREDSEVQIVLHADKKQQHGHARTYNLPATSEVSAILIGSGNGSGNLDIILRCRSTDGQELRRISTCHRSYDPLHYTVMFPYGCDGWHLNMKKSNNKTLSAADFYCFRLQVRADNFNIIMKMRKLMQQYAVDQWAKIESSRLYWARHNQKTIRAEKYQGLLDAAHAGDTVNVGRKIILPPTIYGSPRFYSEAFQNAMAIVRHLGKPDIFITFTCNPKWPEITSALNAGEKPCDRPDLTCRVFKLKYESLMDDIIKKQILGGVKAHTATIEFQKRGLPHAHILLIMDNESKPNCPEIIDRIVCSEIPDIITNPSLHHVITTQNIHGPCGFVNPDSPCMEDTGSGKQCAKNFPKLFSDTTTVTAMSYPQYRRRSPASGGKTHMKKVRNSDFAVDNSFVVPYNPTLSLRYKAHINVEIVHSVQAVKYLYKYITKGQDRVLMALRDGDVDEITHYQNARYISASEAFWRLYGFEIHSKHPPVEKLPCHLPNQQTVIFDQNMTDTALNQGPPVTKLTAYFTKNIEDERARKILYPDFPHYFTWNSNEKKWCRRKRGARNPENPLEVKSECIGRIPTVSLSPHQSELYYLRLLLHHKPGATCFESLKTINNVVCATFQDACRALNLLDDDRERDRAMEEAASIRFGPQLRAVFATILIYCRPSDPFQFWMKHKLELCRDLMTNDLQPIGEIENQVLIQLQDILDTENLDLHNDFQLPKPVYLQETVRDGIPRILQEEMNFDHNSLREKVKQEYNQLNNEQKKVFDAVIQSVESSSGRIFALYASGGTGKTHTINLILAAVRSKKKLPLQLPCPELPLLFCPMAGHFTADAKYHWISMIIQRAVFHQETQLEAFFNAVNSSLLMKCQWDINMFLKP